MQFRGKYIKNAIETLSDNDDNLALRINVEKDYQEKKYEDLKKDFEQCYINGKKARLNEILFDKYFEKFKNGEKLECAVHLKKISLTLLKEKYGTSQIAQNFFELLASQNWIESNI